MSRAQQPCSAARWRLVRLAWLLTGALAGCLNPRPEELPSYVVGPGESPPGPTTGSAGGAGSGGLLDPEAPGDSSSAGTGGSGAGSGGQPSPPSIADAGVDAGAAPDAEPPPDVEPTDAAD